MYNLDEQLMTKSVKQVTKMIGLRNKKDVEATQIIEDYDCYPYNDIPKYKTMVRNAYKAQEAASAWIDAAYPLFGAELWDQMVGDVCGHLDTWNHALLSEGV